MTAPNATYGFVPLNENYGGSSANDFVTEIAGKKHIIDPGTDGIAGTADDLKLYVEGENTLKAGWTLEKLDAALGKSPQKGPPAMPGFVPPPAPDFVDPTTITDWETSAITARDPNGDGIYATIDVTYTSPTSQQWSKIETRVDRKGDATLDADDEVVATNYRPVFGASSGPWGMGGPIEAPDLTHVTDWKKDVVIARDADGNGKYETIDVGYTSASTPQWAKVETHTDHNGNGQIEAEDGIASTAYLSRINISGGWGLPPRN